MMKRHSRGRRVLLRKTGAKGGDEVRIRTGFFQRQEGESTQQDGGDRDQKKKGDPRIQTGLAFRAAFERRRLRSS